LLPPALRSLHTCRASPALPISCLYFILVRSGTYTTVPAYTPPQDVGCYVYPLLLSWNRRTYLPASHTRFRLWLFDGTSIRADWWTFVPGPPYQRGHKRIRLFPAHAITIPQPGLCSVHSGSVWWLYRSLTAGWFQFLVTACTIRPPLDWDVLVLPTAPDDTFGEDLLLPHPPPPPCLPITTTRPALLVAVCVPYLRLHTLTRTISWCRATTTTPATALVCRRAACYRRGNMTTPLPRVFSGSASFLRSCAPDRHFMTWTISVVLHQQFIPGSGWLVAYTCSTRR